MPQYIRDSNISYPSTQALQLKSSQNPSWLLQLEDRTARKINELTLLLYHPSKLSLVLGHQHGRHTN